MGGRRRLEVPRMTDRALWERARLLVERAGPSQNRGPQDLNITLQQLQAVLYELELRGQQLSLLPPLERDRPGSTEWPERAR